MGNPQGGILRREMKRHLSFLENILMEVSEIFPGPYIHIGGDECPKTRWEKCKKCQKRIADEGLKDEHELQSYFIKRIEKVLKNLIKNSSDGMRYSKAD